MVTINTILSRKELAILEKIISNLGYVAHAKDINNLLEKDYSIDEIRKQTSLLSKRGWLVRIKRGVFAVANLESHSFSNVSPLAVSQVLLPNSYVSFEFALGHHHLFDQLPMKLTAVTPQNTKRFTFQDMEYEYKKIKSDLYFGFEELPVNGNRANVAELEKVFLDYLYFRIDTYSIDLVLEKLKEGKGDLDLDKLFAYARKYPFSVMRRLGFLLDLVDVSTEGLHKDIKSRRDFGRLTNASDKFDPKWRIYYEDRLVD